MTPTGSEPFCPKKFGMRSTRAAAVLCLLALVACGSPAKPGSLPLAAEETIPVVSNPIAPPTPIKHVVIIVMENRSFDNYFHGFPGADASSTGVTSTGQKVKLQPTTFAGVGLAHGWTAAISDWDNGKNDGFDIPLPTPVTGAPPPTRLVAYSYVEQPLIAPYWTMAKNYVLADRMFPTMFGPSFTAHLDLIAGTTAVSSTASVVDLPSRLGGCDAKKGATTNLITDKRVYEANRGPFPCFDYYKTIANSLDAKKVSWKYYFEPMPTAALWNAFQAIKAVRYGPDWKNVVYSPKRVLIDAKSGNLPGVSWAIPDFKNSDHPGANSDTGPSWVSAIVNAVGTGPDWKSSAIFVVWDDWGGWYDHVNPPQLDYVGLGLRVPCLIISPYAKHGYVDHTHYEFASILKTIEQIYGLPTMGNSDQRSNGMLDAFDFTQTPRPFVPIAAQYSTDYFIRQPISGQPVDTE
jgi:phospholipase C